MNTPTPLIASALLAASLISGTAHAALEGRDLNGSIDSFEAYYDTVLDITWLADANYAQTSGYDDGNDLVFMRNGAMYWDAATSWAANLSFTDGANVYDNWRLPTVAPVNGVNFDYTVSDDGSTDRGYNITSTSNELSYMYYVNLGNVGHHTPSGTNSGCYVSFPSDTCLDNTGPFSNIQGTVYWATSEIDPTQALYYEIYIGYQAGVRPYGSNFYAWGVSDGDVGIAAIPEPETYAMMLAGLGLVGAMVRRRKLAKV